MHCLVFRVASSPQLHFSARPGDAAGLHVLCSTRGPNAATHAPRPDISTSASTSKVRVQLLDLDTVNL